MPENVVIQTPKTENPSRISWGSIIAGTIIAITAMIVLNQLAISCGLTFVEPLHDSPDGETAKTAAVGAGIAWTASGLISLFVGGWAAAHLARQDDQLDSVLHGVIVWGLFSIVLVMLVASALGAIIGGTFRVVGSGVEATGRAVGGIAQGAGAGLGAAAQPLTERIPAFNWDSLRAEFEDLMDPAARPATEEGQLGASAPAAGQGPRALTALAARAFGSADGSLTEADRKTLIAALARNAGISEEEATKKVAELESQAAKLKADFKAKSEEFEHQVRVAADATARRLAQAAWLGFAATVLGGGAAAFGGLLGNTSARYIRRVVVRTDARSVLA